MGLHMVSNWLFHSDQATLQSETLTSMAMAQKHIETGDIYNSNLFLLKI